MIVPRKKPDKSALLHIQQDHTFIWLMNELYGSFRPTKPHHLPKSWEDQILTVGQQQVIAKLRSLVGIEDEG